MSTQKIYRIAKWRDVFETADSRKHKTLTWVSLPIDRQSSGYQSLIDHYGDDAAAMYGAWCVLVGIAAGCAERGVLANSRGYGLPINRIARMAHMPERLFEKLFEWAISEEIGWLEVDSETPENPQSINDRLPIDQQLVGNRSLIELPNLTLPNPTLPNQEEGATEVAESVAAEPLDDGLVSWIEWWNTLHAASLVPCGVRTGSPAKAVVKAWKRVRRDPELRESLSQRDVIERELRQCEFVRGASWLRPEKMLGGKNRDGAVIVQKLIEGGFRDNQKPKGRVKHDSRNGELFGGNVGTLG